MHEEYVSKARQADQLFVGTPAGKVSAFGEASEPVHRLIDHLANSRVSVAGPQRGKRGQERSAEGERAVVMGQLRRRLSVAAVRAQCLSLHGRHETLAPGHKDCAKHKDKAVEHSRAMARERQAHLEALGQHHSVMRRGFGKVD